LVFFQKLIPEKIRSLWEELLQTDKACLKILGAGGGGYFLAFFNGVPPQAGDFELIPIHQKC
jgi:hypothetical protein